MSCISIDEIHESLLNGQRKQAVSMIDEYGPEFWADYKAYLYTIQVSSYKAFNYYTDIVTSYFRIRA